MSQGMKIRVEKGDYTVLILHGFSHGIYAELLVIGDKTIECYPSRLSYEAGELIPFGTAKRAREFAKYHNQTTRYLGKVG